MREDFEMRILPANAGGFTGDFDGERVVHTFADDVPEFVGRNEHFTGLFDLDLVVGVSDGDFQIGRAQRQRIVLCGKFNAQENGLGSASRDDVTGDGEGFKQGSPIANHFHVQCLSQVFNGERLRLCRSCGKGVENHSSF